MPADIPVTQARAALADLVNRVAYGGERIALTRHGRTVAALVPAEDLERLRRRDAGQDAPAHAVSEVSGPGAGPDRAPARPFGIAARASEPPATRRDPDLRDL
ncbi:type II toxin-antitoxin system Phd/YefM family antitoxin [Streptacidiphilus sp. ASG 303]|uniref:type II toxin-antitoxin system Phd/YefM family antitoxin n=1 Tax=Streptacidiphilus sp. ASG 303 TaxID=2896847 RepID=UPI001E556160|nr:type II toxin-antitoxin system Phd/YefM family antitoxin [Streptacidiphilus sp. ASG 303]MCD0480954.1 type II toxin-antitoxin system Phd/YefM family antitoxin [Streptacidiphilus sp. ASG 303]